MTNKARIGITRDLFDKDGKVIIPGPGLKLLDDIPDIEYKIFPRVFTRDYTESFADENGPCGD